MTLEKLTDIMHEYNGSVAPGSECNAWQDFVEDTHNFHDISPWDDTAADVVCDTDFCAYWQEVANGDSIDYDKSGANSE